MKKMEEKHKHNTVWILTMLTVMVVLSVYYVISDPIAPSNMVDMQIEDSTNINEEEVNTNIEITDITNPDEASSIAPDIITELTDQIGMSNNDFLVTIKMEKDKNRSKQIDQYYTMMQSDISEEAIAELQNKIEQLQTIEESEFILEKLLVAEGYEDAVILTNENNVDVIVKTDTMSNAQAVKIIKMVSDRLDVPAVNVHIKPIN